MDAPPDVAGGDVTTDSFADEIGYDPEGAQQLLADAGYPDGEGFPGLSILIRDDPSNVATAEFIQSNVSETLGIEIEIEIVDAPTRSSRFTNEEFELFPGGWIQDYPDPENWIVGLYDSDGGLNHYNCSNERIDEIVEEALYNTNNEERLELYREANEIVSTTACGSAPLYHQGAHYLVSPELQGPREYADSKDRVIAGDWAVEEWYLEE
ncbi:MAG: ABC transporter substrate-binding protein [Dehalococcoidia bacterium]|nr:ABC transporter substrate-binding protein [Dehalococcoidia bacterium]